MPTPSLRLLGLAALSLAALACSSKGNSQGDGGPTGSLTAPTGLTAIPSPTSLQVQLTWNAEAAATGYEVFRTIAGDEEMLDNPATNGYIDTAPPAGTSITYSVRATNGSAESDESAGVTALTIPPAPTNLASVNISDTSITIGWTEAPGATGGDTVGYVAGHGATVTSGATGTTFTASNLTPDTIYTFTVTARDATGLGPGAVASFTTLASGDGGNDGGTDDGGTVNDGGNNDGGVDSDAGSQDDGGSGNQPGNAFNLTAYGSDTTVILNWDDQGAASYQVFRAHGSGDYSQIGTSAVPNYADLGGSSNPIVTNDSYSYYVVPLDGSGNASPGSSAGTTTAFGIAVVEADRFIDDATSTPIAPDFSSGVTSLALNQNYQVIPYLADGGPDLDIDDTIQGVGSSDGHAVFPGVPVGGYLLFASPPEVYSTIPAATRALDLSTSIPGRTSESQGDATLQLNLTGLTSWDQNNDSLFALSWGAADYTGTGQTVDAALSNPLTDGGTSATGTADSSAIFSNGNLVQASRGDVLYFLQQLLDTSGNTPYLAVRKGYSSASVTLMDSKTTTISGAMSGTPSVTQALTIDLDPAGGTTAFLTYTSAVNPSAAYGDTYSSSNGATIIGAEPTFATNGSYGVSNTPPQLWYGDYDDPNVFSIAPLLFNGAFLSGTANVSFGANQTAIFTNPFPSRWDLFLTTYVPFSVPLQVANVGVVSVVGHMQTQGLLSSYTGPIVAKISPVRSPKINGAAAYASSNAQLGAFDNSSPLVFSWTAPAIGTPTRYTVSLWELGASGIAGTPDAVLQTSSLTAALPPGRLNTSIPYVAIITATNGDADRFGSGVLAYDGAADSADCISSAFTVQ